MLRMSMPSQEAKGQKICQMQQLEIPNHCKLLAGQWLATDKGMTRCGLATMASC